MKDIDDDSPIPESERLLRVGTEFERRLLASRSVDTPAPDLRVRITAEMERVERRSPRPLSLAVAGALLAAAAAVALWARRPPSPQPAARSEVAAAPVPPQNPSQVGAVRPALPGICSKWAVARGGAPLIDDMEDENARLLLRDGRSGAWYAHNDGTAKQEPPPGPGYHPSLLPNRRGNSRFAIHSKGGAFRSWGATLGFELATGACYDASVYRGVSFWARGRGRLFVSARMLDVVSREFGGPCTDNCWDGHGKWIDLERSWQRFDIRWGDIAQKGYGVPVTFDPKRLNAFDFYVNSADTPFDFWIDDVAFLSE